MKKHLILILFFAFAGLSAQAVTANRFFYELTYKANPSSDSLTKEMTILDIMPTKSIYRDYLSVSQDSIVKVEIEQMMRAGTFRDISKSIKQPKFSYKITKNYPQMTMKFTDFILQDKVSYEDNSKFSWNIGPEKAKIGQYNAQKATTTFGGRNWTAWFATDLPFPDGPYKFHGLPGLIVKLEDDKKNYSWVLQGNKKMNDYTEESYTESMLKRFGQGKNDLAVSREKYEQMYAAYKKDPFGSLRTQLSQLPPDAKMPDGTPVAQMLKEQEQKIKKALNADSNSIELPAVKTKK